MRKAEARAHFVSLIAFLFDCEDIPDNEEKPIEDWSIEVSRYVCNTLRGRKDADPNHRVFQIKFE